MQILLSPAKQMQSVAAVATSSLSTPRFQTEALDIATQLSRRSGEELAALLHTTPRIGARAALLAHPATAPAVLTYAGMAYRHLRAETFDTAEMDYAQEHLWITSFLYGLNRPLDGIASYRLEGSAPAPDGEQSLFDYWKSRLTDVLIDSVRADDGVLLYLASGEMKRLFDWTRVTREVRVVAPEFRVMKGEQLKTVVVYVKMMRGAMVRQALTRRLSAPEALLDFEYEGFAHLPDEKIPYLWVCGA